ncbi:MAG: hypothetical protein R3250_04395 [Melioribacteraceae bacterium]|nr:hypothetical protein [Melioribacteraceae bacterium]
MAQLPLEKIKKKLSILRNGVVSDGKILSQDDRRKFWSEIIATSDKTSDRLKASELLGRSEADFTDNVRHGGPDGGPILLQPMNIKGLRDAINREQSKPGLRESSDPLLGNR